MTASLAAPSGLDSFLTTVQGLFSSGMNLPLSSEGTGAGAPGQMTFGEISDYLSRSVDVLAKNTPANLINALETLDGAQHSLGVSVVSIIVDEKVIMDCKYFFLNYAVLL